MKDLFMWTADFMKTTGLSDASEIIKLPFITSMVSCDVAVYS
jgi:hypothetical protein